MDTTCTDHCIHLFRGASRHKKYDELGADGYILKPLNFGNFADAIVNLAFHWSLLAYSAIQNAIGS